MDLGPKKSVDGKAEGKASRKDKSGLRRRQHADKELLHITEKQAERGRRAPAPTPTRGDTHVHMHALTCTLGSTCHVLLRRLSPAGEPHFRVPPRASSSRKGENQRRRDNR